MKQRKFGFRDGFTEKEEERGEEKDNKDLIGKIQEEELEGKGTVYVVPLDKSKFHKSLESGEDERRYNLIIRSFFNSYSHFDDRLYPGFRQNIKDCNMVGNIYDFNYSSLRGKLKRNYGRLFLTDEKGGIEKPILKESIGKVMDGTSKTFNYPFCLDKRGETDESHIHFTLGGVLMEMC